MSLPKPISISKEVFKGTQWYVAMRWCIKGLGFVSSAILARLLLPADFGLVATVMVIYGLLSLLFEFGVNYALIQNNKATDGHFHTAWSLRLLQSLAVALLLGGGAPLIAGLYGDPRLEVICRILALGAFIRGFENIGTVKLQKDMHFSADFRYNVGPKLLSTVITIGLAFHFRSFMALVWGTVLHNMLMVIASYMVVRFRPRFSFVQIADIWGFSQWILIRNLAQYINTQGDILLLSAFATPAKIGFYRWATELSFITISEVQAPFARALVPGLAKIKDDHDRLIRGYLKALSMMTLVAVPLSLGFGAVAEELIPLFLGGGDKWRPVVPLIEALVFFAMTTSISGISGSLLAITGNIKYSALTQWVQALITLASLYPAYQWAGVVGVATTRAGIGAVMVFLVSFLVVSRCRVAFGRILAVVWRPVVSGITMYLALSRISDLLPWPDWQLLMLKVALGAVIYPMLVMLLWALSGRPATFERDVATQIKTRLTPRNIGNQP